MKDRKSDKKTKVIIELYSENLICTEKIRRQIQTESKNDALDLPKENIEDTKKNWVTDGQRL